MKKILTTIVCAMISFAIAYTMDYHAKDLTELNIVIEFVITSLAYTIIVSMLWFSVMANKENQFHL